MQPTDQLVSRVPEHIVVNARARDAANGGHLSDYNVAAWLQVPGMAELPVTLLASYGDGERAREVVIDHGALNASGRILLSGIARLPHRHRIDNLQIKLRSAVGLARLTVEELFVQAVEQIAIQDGRIHAGSL
ncbi:hypothetical protein [Pseudomonas citronellolis]|uniref:hypothetical protein n=1 Tax=Pseudomonas citronellolis TaxID=53408 RepID=UPI0023E455C8|nr:hypothetical protein [Pseudomonas citronellolis]MDF3932800.1 hypothetical protein [Pseudomonas citronellolis]